MTTTPDIQQLLTDSSHALQSCAGDERLVKQIQNAANAIVDTFMAGNRMFIFGNGGSAADSQHIACELISRLKHERQALPCYALTTNTSVLTAISNDYAFDTIFSRQLEAFAKSGDIALGISTSGRSTNIINAFNTAKNIGMTTIALMGGTTTPMTDMVDTALMVPSTTTQCVQECHIAIGHIICALVETAFLDTSAS